MLRVNMTQYFCKSCFTQLSRHLPRFDSQEVLEQPPVNTKDQLDQLYHDDL